MRKILTELPFPSIVINLCKEFFFFFIFLGGILIFLLHFCVFGILFCLLRFCVYGSFDELFYINPLMPGGNREIVHT